MERIRLEARALEVLTPASNPGRYHLPRTPYPPSSARKSFIVFRLQSSMMAKCRNIQDLCTKSFVSTG